MLTSLLTLLVTIYPRIACFMIIQPVSYKKITLRLFSRKTVKGRWNRRKSHKTRLIFLFVFLTTKSFYSALFSVTTCIELGIQIREEVEWQILAQQYSSPVEAICIRPRTIQFVLTDTRDKRQPRLHGNQNHE